MSDRLAAVALRLLAPRATAGANVVDGDDLANLNPTNLPDHAMCWVREGNGTLYQLDRDASGATIAYADGLAFQVDPNEGPGLWLPVEGEAIERLNWYTDINVDALGVLVTGANTWSVFNAGITTGIQGSPDIAPLFTLGSNFLITYNGPPQLFEVEMYVNASNNTGANTTEAKLAIQDSDTLLLGTTNTPLGESIATMTAGTTVHLYNKRLITLADDTFGTFPSSLLPIMRSTNGDNLAIEGGRLTVTPK